LIDVTVLLLDGTFSSTAVGPMEVFRHAGSLWNVLTGKRPAPHFEVTTASATDEPSACDGQIRIRPNAAIAAIRKTDLIFIPTTGLSLDDVVERNAPGYPVAAALAQAGSGHCQRLLGRGSHCGYRHAGRQTRHHTLGFGRALPRKVSEGKMDAGIDGHRDSGFYCGGGVHAALDLSLYLVEKFSGDEPACHAPGAADRSARAWHALHRPFENDPRPDIG